MPNSSHLPDIRIRINGVDLQGLVNQDIVAVTIQEDLDATSMFSIDLYNWNPQLQQATWSDDKRFLPGGEVEISLGYVDSLLKVMTGEVTSLEPSFQADEIPRLTVRGHDHRHRMLRGKKTRSYNRMKDSAIASQVAHASGLRPKVTDSRVTHEYVLQHNQTDLAFLQERARRIGYEIYVRDKVLYFQPPGLTGQPVTTLRLSQDIVDFFPRLTTMSQASEVRVQGWDQKGKQTISGSATSVTASMGRASGPLATRRAFGKSSVPLVRSSVTIKAEADQMAGGQLEEMAAHYIRGEVLCEGRPELHAGQVVKIEEAGKVFSGPYYVTAVTHTVDQARGYQTRLNVRRNAA